MKKTQTITLKISYNDNVTEHPGNWNWPDLLDMGNETVQVLEVDGRPVLEKQTPDG